jgi:chromosome segregation and condensation protein ScpB
LAPELERRALPSSVEEVLFWAAEPLATAEVAAICEIEHDEARTELARVAREEAVGPDGWWTVSAAPQILSRAA